MRIYFLFLILKRKVWVKGLYLGRPSEGALLQLSKGKLMTCLRRRGFLHKPGCAFPCISPGSYPCCTAQWIQEFTPLTHCRKGQVYAFLSRTNVWNVWDVSESCLGLYSSRHSMRANSGEAILCALGSCCAPAGCSVPGSAGPVYCKHLVQYTQFFQQELDILFQISHSFYVHSQYT